MRLHVDDSFHENVVAGALHDAGYATLMSGALLTLHPDARLKSQGIPFRCRWSPWRACGLPSLARSSRVLGGVDQAST